jgi:A/G-specific adenine glycosylase
MRNMPGIAKNSFTPQLMKWNREKNDRPMPWKGETDPYKIWLSEIILQQTRVEQGWKYYENFIKAFPNIKKLALAPEQKIFKLWEGLGYYTRCRNMIFTSKYIYKEFNGKFPNSYEGILALKGIGPYTAAAIASFAYNLPHAVVDGNVFRVLARYFGLATPIDNNEGKKLYNQLATELLDKKEPGKYNQAIMDLGAVICKPQNPTCGQCPLKKQCIANASQLTRELPVKEKKLVKKTRHFYYFVIKVGDKIMLRKRSAKDIWEDLYEFVLFEMEPLPMTTASSIAPLLQKLLGKKPITVKHISEIFRQLLTHQTILAQFILVSTSKAPALEDFELIKIGSLAQYPLPRLINSYLEQHSKQFVT